VITMSLGGPDDDTSLHDAIKHAVQQDILVVCASGNSGDNNLQTDEVMYPGYYIRTATRG
jgi:major intracellular serine protease